jgi:DNA polymerase-3 subunit epsilon
VSEVGVRFTAQSPLIQRALEAIGRSPQPTPALAREVFGLRQAPPGLASRLVFDLLGTDGRFEVDREGVWRLAEATADPARLALEDAAFAVVDVETTGSAVSRGARIVEYSAVLVQAGEILGEYTTLVNPEDHIPRWVTKLTGIDRRMVEDAPRFRDISASVRRSLEGRVFVAHNVAFDWRFVAEELRRANAVMPEGPRLCTVRLARRVLPGLRRRGLDALARYYDVEIRNRHRAGDDARAAAAILIRMLEAADRLGVRYWDQLEDWIAGRPFVPGSEKSSGGKVV